MAAGNAADGLLPASARFHDKPGILPEALDQPEHLRVIVYNEKSRTGGRHRLLIGLFLSPLKAA
jgi:hypothetical protein